MILSVKFPNSKYYRPDVDGLRAIAVLAVVLFHIDILAFEGGYVGVDVFFVISGYLITKKLLAERELGKIDYKAFYTSRIRRLFPAIFATVFCSFVASWFFLRPAALSEFSTSAIAAIVSLSNFFFFGQSGYWDAASHTKPLLHTWSLAVEEQFYIFWPVFISTLFAIKRAASVWLGLLIIGLISLALAEYFLRISPSAVFFLTPFRVCEFVVGGLCVALDKKNYPNTVLSQMAFSGLSMTGLCLVAYSVLTFDKNTVFPGLSSMIPCLGTAMVILARNPKPLRFLISNPIAIFIGLISYSFYLVHWPIVTLYKIKTGADLANYEQLFIFLSALVSAYLMYVFVERPFRKKSFFKSQEEISGAMVGLVATSISLFFSLVVILVVYLDGLPLRKSVQITSVNIQSPEEMSRARRFLLKKSCQNFKKLKCGKVKRNRRNVLVIGDSHTLDGLNIMHEVYPKANFLVAYAPGCAPLLDLSGVKRAKKTCADKNVERFMWLKELNGLDEVVFSMRLSNDRVLPLINTIEVLQSDGYTVSVIGAGPIYSERVYDLVFRNRQKSIVEVNEIVQSHMDPEIFNVDEQLRPIIAKGGGEFYDKLSFICPQKKCKLTTKEREIFIFDKHHMTLSGASEVGKYLASEF